VPDSSLPPTVAAFAENLGSAIGEARIQIGRGVRSLLVGENEPVRDLYAPIDGDPGYFGPDSVTWRVHADGSMLIGGLRALFFQMMHPLAMAGVAEHSDYKRHPLDRLANTSQFVAVTTFGTKEQADQAFAMVDRVHQRVRGTAPDGRPYSATDPHLVSWVHHAEVVSFLAAYQRYGVLPLSNSEADAYVNEMAIICERLGGETPARSVAELHDVLNAFEPELVASDQARDASRWLLRAPLPLTARPAFAVIAPAAIGLLPKNVREDLRLPHIEQIDPVLVQPAARTLVRTLEWAIEGAMMADSGN
jgi:uncharacterized protein (DUF2236 family)